MGLMLAEPGGTLANTSEPGPQGRELGSASAEWDGAETPGPTSQLCPPFLFPPGPADSLAWTAAVSMAPGLAPAVAFGDIARRAQELGALVAQRELAEAQAESELRRMADGLASRTRALRLLGNGVHPLAAAHAWRTLALSLHLWPVDLARAFRVAAE